jgi:Na+/proline symporter
LLGLIVSIVYIMQQSGDGLGAVMGELNEKGLSRIFNTDINSPSFFLKHILGGAFITVAMTGLDQEMMQKNISVKRLGDSQKNMMTFNITMAAVNFLFLLLGGLLYLFAAQKNINVPPDDLFPTIALSHMPTWVSIIFIIGLISALFPSADGALTALTSSFCIDILGLKRNAEWDEKRKKKIRLTVHFIFALLFFLLVLGFKYMDNKSIIDVILKVAGFTYGPLLGLFAFGILTKRVINDRYSLIICLFAPLLILSIDFINNVDWYVKQLNLSGLWLTDMRSFSASFFGSFKIGYELLIYNGILTFLGLLIISKKPAEG